jgi:hypothetical protein
MLTRTLTLAVVMVAVSAVAHAQAPRYDGNWWMATSEAAAKQSDDIQIAIRAGYVIGLLDGASTLGEEVAADRHRAKARETAGPFASLTTVLDLDNRELEAYRLTANRLLLNVSGAQLRDALDLFYQDAANRRILVVDAAFIALNRIAGVPQAEIEAMTVRQRRVASFSR